MNVLLACMYLYHMCAWYLQVRRCGALGNWSLWSKVFGALASVLVPIEVRGVRFPPRAEITESCELSDGSAGN